MADAGFDIDDTIAQFRSSAEAAVAQQKQQTLSAATPPIANAPDISQPQQAMSPDESIDDTIADFRKNATNIVGNLDRMQRVGAVTQSINDSAKAASLPPDATDQVKAAGSYDAFTQAMIAHAQTANGVLFGDTQPLPPSLATKEDAGLDDETSPTAHANALQAMREASPDYVRPGVVPAIGRIGSGAQAGAVEGVTQAAQGLSVLFNDKPYLEPFYGQYLDVPKMSADELTAFRAKITAAWRSGSITQAESNRLQSDISDAHSGEPLLNPSEFAGVAPEDSASWKAAEAWKQKWLPTVTNAEKGTFTYQLGQMAGSAAVVLPASIAAGVVGGPGAAIAVGGAMMGAQGAQQGYEDARSLLRDQQTNFPPTQRNYDADAQRQQAQTQIEYAKKQGALSGVLGSIDVGVVLRPIERAAPGITSWALAKLQHMAQSGVTFATVGEAQTALGAELKKDIDPNAQYDFDWQRVAQELITGTAMGVAAPTHLSEETRNDLTGVTGAVDAFSPQGAETPTHRIMLPEERERLAATVALSPEAQTARSVDSLAAVQPPEERPATAAPARSADDHAREIAPEAFDKRDSLIKRIQWYDEALGTQHGAIAQGHAQLVNDHFDEQVHPLNDQLEKLNDRLDAANQEPGKHGLKETLRGKINDLTTQVQAIEDERGKSLANLPVGDDTWTRKILDARAQASKDLYDLTPTLRAARDEGERRVLAEQPVADTQAAPVNEPGPAEQTAEPIAETPTPVMPTTTPEVEAAVKQALADEAKRSTTTDEHTRAIANDVSTQLTRVGYSPDVATAMGHMAATAYRVRANRWGGARGTALDLYNAERMTHQSYRDLEKKDRKQRVANREKALMQSAQGVTDTPAFKQWFGDSKVVDENGEPLVVYKAMHPYDWTKETDETQGPEIESIHRSTEFPAFNHGERGVRIAGFFGDKATANRFTPGSENSAIYPVYLKIEKPYVVDAAGKKAGNIQFGASGQSFRDAIRSGKYDGVIIKNTVDEGDVYVALKPGQIKSTFNRGTFDANDPRILHQAEAENEEPKGMINWKGTRAFITYLRHADASTALHEMSHHLIEMMRLDADDPHAPQDIKDDIAKLREYVGNQSERGGFTREQHEKLADSLEQYYFDGRAPSPELKPIFERLRQWMKQIYDEIVGKGIKIPDDVRAVFDRMFAERPERQEVAESQGTDAVHPAKAIADMHEADAAHATTQDAEHVGDTVDEETVKTATDHAPETGVEHVGPEGQIDASARDAGADSSAGKGAKSEPGRAGSSQATDAQRERPGRPAAEVDGPRPGGSDRLDDGSGANSGTAAKRSGPDRAGNINLDTLNSTADAKNLIRQLVAQNTDFFNDKRFGSAAYQLQAEIAAARQLFEAVTKQTVTALKKWRASGDENDALAYHKSTEQMLLAAGEVSQYASMWGRAGSSFKKLSKIRPGETPEQFIKRTTGMTLFQLADEATAVDGLDNDDQRLGMIADNRRSVWQNGRSYLLAYYINNLISGPITHAAYTEANYLWALFKAGVFTPVEAALGKLHGDQDEYRVHIGEVGQQMGAVWRHLGDPAKGAFEAARTVLYDAPTGLRSAGRAFSTGVPFMEGQYAMDVREKIDAQAHASAEMAGLAKDSDAYQQHVDAFNERPPQNVLDAAKAEAEAQYNIKQQVIPGFAGRVIEAPGRAVSMLHQMMYGMNYESEIARRAYRSAAAEDLVPGTPEFDAHVAQFRMHPPDADVAEAHDEALDMMLMHRSPYDSSMMHLQRWANSNIVAKIIMPFVKIGSNILRRNFLEMTPLGYLSPEIRADLMGENGTIKRSAAEAKVIVGTTMAAGVFGMAASGLITGSGPADPKEAAMWRAAGNRAYTMTIGGMQVPYRKYLPFGTLWGMAADMYEVGKAGLGEGGGFGKATATLGFAFAEAVVDETWMSGMSRAMDAVHSVDPDKGEKYLRDTAMSFIPYSVGVTQVARTIDPYARNVNSWLDAVKSRLPGLSETLYPKIDTWGRPILSHMMTGVSADHNDPISTEAERVDFWPSPVEKKISGVELTPAQYEQYARTRGNLLRDAVQKIMRLPRYPDIPDEAKKEMFSAALKQTTKEAADAMRVKSVNSDHDILKQRDAAKRAYAAALTAH